MENYIPVKTRKETARVRIEEILYIESELRIIVIYTEKRVYRFYSKLDDLIRYLNDEFYRIHKSCVINLDRIEWMQDGIIYFSEGQSVRVGRNNYRLAKSRYRQFLEENEAKDSTPATQVCESSRGFE